MADRDLVRKDRQTSNTSTPRGKNYLLAIAINDYQHCTKLSNAVLDVEAFIELMTSRYNFEKDNITFIKDTEATKRRIDRAFDRLIDMVSDQDNLVVYFSGHGRYHERRGGFWIPVEAGTSDEDWPDYLSNDHIKNYLARIKSFHTFLIADSCFSGTLFFDKSKEKFSGGRRDTEPSRWGLTSGKKEIVSDGQPGLYSPFAAALLDVLRKAEQPPGVMRICDLVLEKVAANAQQTPMGSPLQVAGHQGGQLVFYFRENEDQVWEAALAVNTIKAYTDYYDQYPQGKYSELALDRLEELEEKELWNKVPKNRQALLLRFIRENPHSPFVNEAKLLVAAFRETIVNFTKEEKQEAKPIVKPKVPPTIILPQPIVPEHMVLVEGGTFEIGEDKATHTVELSDFLMAKHQLTFEEYKAFWLAGWREGRRLPHDQNWRGGNRPVIDVKWVDAVEYCNWRSKLEELKPVYIIRKNKVIADWSACGYRLPTEAEWEYAARGGVNSQRFTYAGSHKVNEVAWYYSNSKEKTHPVGQKKTNELGLYDMSGNVREWCWDWHGAYPIEAQINPKGPDTGSYRVCRGGSWNDLLADMRVTDRRYYEPYSCTIDIGFRLARSAVAL